MPKMITESAIRKQIAALQEKLKKSDRGRINKIKLVIKLMAKHGVTIDDLRNAAGSRKPEKAAADGRRKPARIKYRDNGGNTWTGRGRAPLWLVAAEKAGHKRDEFLMTQ